MLKELRRLGSEALAKAVKSCISDPQKGEFCPQTAKIASYAPPVEHQIAYCGNCVDGWVMVPDYEARRLYKNETATATLRCQCSRIDREARVGRG
jgi:hypothetical protein